MLKAVISGQQLSSDQMKLLEDSPRQLLKAEQRKLNDKRKFMNKQRQLQKKYQENQENYNNWMAAQRLLMKQEKERFEAEQNRITRELDKMKEMEMEEDQEEDFADLDPCEKGEDMNARLLAAESKAWEAQQAMLMMQMQFQQFTAYATQQLANAGPPEPMPSTPAVNPGERNAMAPFATTATNSPSTGPMGRKTRHENGPYAKAPHPDGQENGETPKTAETEAPQASAGAVLHLRLVGMSQQVDLQILESAWSHFPMMRIAVREKALLQAGSLQDRSLPSLVKNQHVKKVPLNEWQLTSNTRLLVSGMTSRL